MTFFQAFWHSGRTGKAETSSALPRIAKEKMSSHLNRNLRLVSACLAFACTAAQANPTFAPAGTKATLTVDYLYESAGSKRSEGMYDPHEWRVKRTVSIAAELVAQAATALTSVLHAGA